MKTEIEILKEVQAELEAQIKLAENQAFGKTELARELRGVSNHFFGRQRDLERQAESAAKVMPMAVSAISCGERPGL